MRQALEARHLYLDDVPVEAWTAFQSGTHAAVAPELIATWQRSRALGALASTTPAAELLMRGAELRERSQRLDELARSFPSVLASVPGADLLRDYALLLADPEGVVVQTMGGGAFADEAARVRLIAGACWSEAMRGTNAIGTAVSEDAVCTVLGHAHYGADFHGLVCYATPIHAPDGSLVAVLDATSYRELASDVARATIVAAGVIWERTLRASALDAAGFRAQALTRRKNPVFLIERAGRIFRGNEAARAMVPRLPADAADVLGLDWARLVQHATQSSSSVTIASRFTRSPQRVQLEPVIAKDGSIVAVVAELCPMPTRALPARRGDAFDAIFATDAAVCSAITWARKVAASELPVMILGETGTGKELVAQAIHAESKRARGPFIAVNCGAIAPQLLESELFGYAPFAFTGADRGGRHGLIHAAAGGTLFLDEVADMPPAMQVALLRVLEDNVYRRVGESETQTANARFICATCRELPALVEKGEFRRDLYFRLKGATVNLPPLRERTDVVPLAQHVLGELAARAGRFAPMLSPELAEWIGAQQWSGNVRELKSLLEVALVLADTPVLELEHLPPDALGKTAPVRVAVGQLGDVEAQAVRRALNETSGNISAAAAKLGVARSTLYRMMRRHGLVAASDTLR